MHSQPSKREDLLAHCGELRDDDGVDPREFFKKPVDRSGRRKTHQLCRQVADALSQILAGEFDDDLLLGLAVVAVEPAPNESQLLVTLRSDHADHAAVLAKLSAVAGILRTEITASITRKRAPKLRFHVM